MAALHDSPQFNSIVPALGIVLPAQLTLVIQTAHNIAFAFAVLPGGIGLMESLDRSLLSAWGGVSPAQMFSFMVSCCSSARVCASRAWARLGA